MTMAPNWPKLPDGNVEVDAEYLESLEALSDLERLHMINAAWNDAIITGTGVLKTNGSQVTYISVDEWDNMRTPDEFRDQCLIPR